MAGVLPPIRPGTDPAGHDRSPYLVTMEDLVIRFATSRARASILQGLIEFRREMDAIGLTQGFQWVDGSFLEYVEDTEGRAPNDIDVVSYVYLPYGETQQTFMPRLQPLLDRTVVKKRYKVDAFFRILPEVEIRDVCYWYSLWSHRRDGLWKGFAEIPLNLADDAQAQGELERILAMDLAHDQ